MKNKISLIFLDVDGPINSDYNKENQYRSRKSICSFHIELPPSTILNLKKIVESGPNIKIVLCSNWRLGGFPSLARQNLEKQLNYYGLEIYDETPRFDKVKSLEISTYLETFESMYGYTPAYIILENEVDRLIRYHKGHLVNCNTKYGLTEKEVNISINLLRKFSR